MELIEKVLTYSERVRISELARRLDETKFVEEMRDCYNEIASIVENGKKRYVKELIENREQSATKAF